MGKRELFIITFLFLSMVVPLTIKTQEVSAAPKEWTIMVYLDGDNNLEAAAIDDFNEMEASGGTTASVNILAIFDRCSYGYESGVYPEDWSGTRYYEVQSDSDMYTINSPVVQDLGEQNMGDLTTLSNFVAWSKSNYPADKYALFLWDHGGGINGVCWDEDNGDDYLDMTELQALPYSDFLCFDACVMGQIEVLYEVLNQCEYLGASSQNVPYDGMDYTSLLSVLISNPTMNVEDFSKIVCQTYVDFYRYTNPVSFCVYDTKDLTSILSLTNSLSQALIDNLATYKADIWQARFETYPLSLLEICDFHQFLTNLKDIDSSAISTAANNYLTALETALVISETNMKNYPVGFTIYFPLPYYEGITVDYCNNVFSSVFITYTLWDEFILDWINEVNALNPFWSTWDSGGDVIGTISEGEYYMIAASMPEGGNSFQAILTFEQNMDLDLAVWNSQLLDGETGGFFTSSRMPFDIPESVVFTLNTLYPSRMVFFIYCKSGSGAYTLHSNNYISFSEDSYEENDNFAQSSSIQTNSTYALIGYDDDYYNVDLAIGDNVFVALGFDNENDYDLYVYDKNFVEIDYSWYDVPEIISFAAGYTGRYYILVEPYDIQVEPYYLLSTRIFPDSPPIISNIISIPDTPSTSDVVTISCTVTDSIGVNSVSLVYNTSSGWVNVPMVNIGSSVYSADIPAPENTSCVNFYIIAEDVYGYTATSTLQQIIYSYQTTKTSYFSVYFLLSFIVVNTVIKKKKWMNTNQ